MHFKFNNDVEHRTSLSCPQQSKQLWQCIIRISNYSFFNTNVSYFRISSAYSTLLNFFFLWVSSGCVPTHFWQEKQWDVNDIKRKHLMFSARPFVKRRTMRLQNELTATSVCRFWLLKCHFQNFVTDDILTQTICLFVLHFIQPISFSPNSHSLFWSSVFTWSH